MFSKKKYFFIVIGLIFSIICIIYNIIWFRYNLVMLFSYLSPPYTCVKEWGCKGFFDKEKFYIPDAFTIDSKGYIYIQYSTLQRGNSCIQKFDSNGNFIEKWGSNGDKSSQFISIVDICTDSKDNIYIVDSAMFESPSAMVFKFNTKGKLLSIISEKEKDLFPTFCYYQIAVDREENTFITQSDDVRKFNSAGNLITSWKISGSTNDIKLDSEDNVYIASSISYPTGNLVLRNGDFCTSYEKEEIWHSSINKFDSSGKVLYKDGYFGLNRGNVT